MATQPRKRLRREDYGVGIICALPLELAAVQALLSEEHLPLGRRDEDTNSYAFGRIGEHNVVIACLPYGQYGVTSAAEVVTQLVTSFPIKMGLMVGIAGGVPNERNKMRLGDIVVSKPEGQYGGVVYYDRVKVVPGETPEGQKGSDPEYILDGHLNPPPQSLLTALGQLEAQHMIKGNKLAKYLQEGYDRYPKFREDFACPNLETDILFASNYEHVRDDDNVDGETPCLNCDSDRLLDRKTRKPEGIHIHYGLIGSGNQLMRHAATRDELGRKLNILCFEMEAAGLMRRPFLIIRGICDYADSHKNKLWQRYAASVAAAYARELLESIPGREVTDIEPVSGQYLFTSGQPANPLTSEEAGIQASSSASMTREQFLMLSSSAIHVYRECRDCRGNFEALTNDVQRLGIKIGDLEDLVRDKFLRYEDELELFRQAQKSSELFSEMDSVLRMYNSLDSQSRRTRERLQWDQEALASFQERLSTNITALTQYYADFISSGYYKVFQAIRQLIIDYQSGRRDMSSVTSLHNESDEDGPEWLYVKQEMLDLGVSDVLAQDYKAVVIQTLTSAVADGEIEVSDNNSLAEAIGIASSPEEYVHSDNASAAAAKLSQHGSNVETQSLSAQTAPMSSAAISTANHTSTRAKTFYTARKSMDKDGIHIETGDSRPSFRYPHPCDENWPSTHWTACWCSDDLFAELQKDGGLRIIDHDVIKWATTEHTYGIKVTLPFTQAELSWQRMNRPGLTIREHQSAVLMRSTFAQLLKFGRYRYGLAVSSCTFNAQRTRIMDMFSLPGMLELLKDFCPESTIREDLITVLADSTTSQSNLANLYDRRKDCRSAILKCLRYLWAVLLKTGLDSQGKELRVLWVPKGEAIPYLIRLQASEHHWINMLRDTYESLTLAVLVEENLSPQASCLYAKKCGDGRKNTLLETAIQVTRTSGLFGAKLERTNETVNAEKVWNIANVKRRQIFQLDSRDHLMIEGFNGNYCLLLNWVLRRNPILEQAKGAVKCREQTSDDPVPADVFPIPVHIR